MSVGNGLDSKVLAAHEDLSSDPQNTHHLDMAMPPWKYQLHWWDWKVVVVGAVGGGSSGLAGYSAQSSLSGEFQVQWEAISESKV